MDLKNTNTDINCRVCQRPLEKGACPLCPEDDHSSPSYCFGAVLAQVEDLDREDAMRVLSLAAAEVEATWAVPK